MPKKTSSKVQNVTKEEPDSVNEKQVTTSKKKDEIDEIFSTKKKRKNPEKEKNVERIGVKNEKMKNTKKKKKSKVSRESEVEPNSKPRRRTNDGLVIYTEDELGINKQAGGGTADCPFDCSCCF